MNPMPCKSGRLLPLLSLSLSLVISSAPAFAADTAGGQFREWSTNSLVSRSMTLRDLGFDQPLSLRGQDNQREIYLPVPAGVATRNAQLQLDARYMRGHPGHTSNLLSIDDDAVAARTITDAQGDLSQLIGIDGFARPNGFVRFGVGWWSIVSDYQCADQSAPANVLRIGPDTRFSYEFDGSAIDTVGKAWTALPRNVRLLVEGRQLDVASYDTAWRVGAVLESAGKRVSVSALPKVGDSIDLRGTQVPASLMGVPAYAALATAEAQHRVASEAEIGALLSLGRSSGLPIDVAVASPALRAAVKRALDALGSEVAGADADGAAAFAAWRKSGMAPLETAVDGSNVSAGVVAGQPMLVVGTGAAAQVAGLFTAQWRAYALGKNLQVNKAQPLVDDKDVVLLDRLGAFSGTQDIIARSDRITSADLGLISAEGKLPSEVVIDVSAAPNSAGEGAVASIFFNDFLLGAKVLNTDGKPQRISATVPLYAIAARNEVKVSFLRQPARPHCHDPATPYPVSLLPSSHIVLAERGTSPDFVGAAARLAGPHHVLVPEAWLQNAPATLQTVIRVSSAVGASVERATLDVVKGKAVPAQTQPYLAFNLQPEGTKTAATIDGGHLRINGKKDDTVLDLAGLDDSALVEVAGGADTLGVVYRELGNRVPSIAEPFRLVRGSVALLDGRGVVQDFDHEDPAGLRVAVDGNPQPVWQRHMVWLLVLVGVILFLLLAARVAQVRHRRKFDATH